VTASSKSLLRRKRESADADLLLPWQTTSPPVGIYYLLAPRVEFGNLELCFMKQR
jgi:hypothetical protein